MQNNTSLCSFEEELNKTLSLMMQNISVIEEKSESDDFVSDIEYFIEKFNSLKCDDKLIAMDLPNTNQIDNKEQELNVQNLPNISTLPKTRKINKAVEDAKKALTSFKKTINRISKQTGLKIRIPKKKLELYFEENSLEDIQKKTLENIFGSIYDKNRRVIRNIKNALKGKNGFRAFNVLMKLSFEEIYDYYKEDCKLIYHKKKFIILTGKFDTLKDIKRQEPKKLRRLKLKTIKSRHNNNANEEPMEIEKEVFAILID